MARKNQIDAHLDEAMDAHPVQYEADGLSSIIGRGALAITPGTDTELSYEEADELQRCEQIVARGLKTFFEVGVALMRVRDLRLYRVEYRTFEDYCQNRWDMGRQYVNRIIAASQVRENLVPIGTKFPENEAQARPLTKLRDPEQQREAWRAVLERAEQDGRLNAQIVEEVVRQMLPSGRSMGSGTDGSVVIESTATEVDDQPLLPFITLPEDLTGWTVTTHNDYYAAEYDGLRVTDADADTLFAEARAICTLHDLGWGLTQNDGPPHWVGTHLEYDSIAGSRPSELLEQAQNLVGQLQPALSTQERTLLASIPQRLPGSPTSLHPLDMEALRPLLEWMRERMQP